MTICNCTKRTARTPQKYSRLYVQWTVNRSYPRIEDSFVFLLFLVCICIFCYAEHNLDSAGNVSLPLLFDNLIPLTRICVYRRRRLRLICRIEPIKALFLNFWVFTWFSDILSFIPLYFLAAIGLFSFSFNKTYLKRKLFVGNKNYEAEVNFLNRSINVSFKWWNWTHAEKTIMLRKLTFPFSII